MCMDETQIKSLAKYMLKNLPMNIGLIRFGNDNSLLEVPEVQQLFELLLLKGVDSLNKNTSALYEHEKLMDKFITSLNHKYEEPHRLLPTTHIERGRGRPRGARNGPKMDTCSVEGCSNPYAAKGYCMKHYSQLRRGRVIDIDATSIDKTVCSVTGCESKVMSKMLCSKHYDQIRNRPELRDHIMAGGEIRRVPRRDKQCLVDGCEGKHKAHGYCNSHYLQLRHLGIIQVNPTYRSKP